MVNVAIVGATGYTGEELIDVLIGHPQVKIDSLSAIVEKEKKFAELYPRFEKRIDLICRNLDIEKVASGSEIVFLALPHTVSMKIAPEFLKKGKKVIDLSADYRLPADVYAKWYETAHSDEANLKEAVYGLPELNREKIKKARLISNPGCYPTSVILGLLPALKGLGGKVEVIIADSKSGVTGAGRKAAIPLLFGEVSENFKCYKANEHQHMPEMENVLSAACGNTVNMNFVPHLLPVKRGILSTMYVQPAKAVDEEKLHAAYREAYKNEPFVRVLPRGAMPQLQDVVGTNYCDIGIKVAKGLLIIVSVIDNLLKGASGQAVQNMNIIMGFDEKTGLA